MYTSSRRMPWARARSRIRAAMSMRAWVASGADLRADPLTEKHAAWAGGFAPGYAITADNALDIVYRETGLVFARVLEDAGVYKRTPEGQAAFLRFLRQV